MTEAAKLMKSVIRIICNTRRKALSFFRCDHGATAVEFAIIGPLLLMVSFGIVELGRLFWTQHNMTQELDVAERQIYLDPTKATDATKRATLESWIEARFTEPTVATISAPAGGFSTLTLSQNFNLMIPFWEQPFTAITLSRNVPVT